jgi:hypothetical protein
MDQGECKDQEGECQASPLPLFMSEKSCVLIFVCTLLKYTVCFAHDIVHNSLNF